MIIATLLCSVLPVIPQPRHWAPAEGICDLARAEVVVETVKDVALGDEGYRMTIRPDRIDILVAAKRGEIWARQTLAQLRTKGAAAQCGTIFDKPKYRVRGLVIDVARMYQSMDFLYDVARTMSYYKMNVLQVHLNDNEICKDPKADWSTKYAAFRMECETCPELTAKDGSYSKREFRRFMRDCEAMGVTVIPEFDVPAHALAFTRARPEFASDRYGADHFDLEKSYEIVPWLKTIFAEYLEPEEHWWDPFGWFVEEPVFIGPYMHVGTDEYNRREAERFRSFMDAMLRMVRGFGYKPCAWGSLSNAKGAMPVLADRDITMDIWYNPYYQPEEALKAGYSIVSVPDGLTYIVPFAGYYYDFLNCRGLYENWEPRRVGNYVVPDEYLPQLEGGKFALWNDMLGKKKDGTAYTEDDNWKRLFPPMQTLGQKFWTGARADEDWNTFKAIADRLGTPEGVRR